MAAINIFLGALFGAFVGKFMALTTQYLPQMLLAGCPVGMEPVNLWTWYFQRPACRECRKSLSWMENFPIFGYLALKGKCPHCGQAIGKRVIILETGMALFYGTSFFFFPLDPASVFVLFISTILICGFITDFEHGLLPDQLTMTMVWGAMIGSLYPIFVTPQEAILGAVGGYGIFWGINALYSYFRGFEGMYPGDFKLNAGIGACVGLKWLLIILLIALVFLVSVTLFRIFFGEKKSDVNPLHTEAPYGCYSSIATIAVLYGMLSGFLGLT